MATITEMQKLYEPLLKPPPLITHPPIITPLPYQCPTSPRHPITDPRPPYRNPQISPTAKLIIPSVELNEIHNPPPLDFQQLKLPPSSKEHNGSSRLSLYIINDEDRPHTNEVTYYNKQ